MTELAPDLVEARPHLANRVEVLACSQPHDYDVVAHVQVVGAGGPFPGDDALARFAADECADAVSAHVAASPDQPVLEVVRWLPTRRPWALGHDDLLCGVVGAR